MFQISYYHFLYFTQHRLCCSLYMFNRSSSSNCHLNINIVIRQWNLRTIEKKPRYHEGRGKRLKRYGDGWTDDGREYYQQLLGNFKILKNSNVWNTLQNYWKLYQKKQYNKGNDNQDDDIGGPDEECDESDEEDWRMEVEDNIECNGSDDIILSDNEDEPPRNRQRMTL